MKSIIAITTLTLLSAAAAWAPGLARCSRIAGARRFAQSPALKMAMDYNDPVVAEEFAKVQPMDFDDVELELKSKGIPVPPTMK